MRNIIVVPGIALLLVIHQSIQSTAAQDFTILHTFTGEDGGNPAAALIVVSNRLFGTTSEFWGSKRGTVFAINTDGSDFQTLYRFSAPIYDPPSAGYTNSDGNTPMAG